MVIDIITHSYISIGQIREAYKEQKIEISWWAEDLIRKVVISKTSENKRIKVLSGKELGFLDKALNSDIYQRATSSGLRLITAESALLMMLKIEGDGILSGMEPIRLTDGDPMIFRFEKKKLTASFALPSQMVWEAQIKWAFELPY